MNLRLILLKFLFVALPMPATVGVKAQSVDPAILNKQWKAHWIGVPGEDDKAYGIYYFRKQVELVSKPASLVIHISADNRYKLFVNEKLVSLGPARGDVTHWNYETLDIATYLVAGKNTIAAQVWNEGDWRPEAQISLKTGIIIQGASTDAEILNTGTSWKCIRDTSYKPLALTTPNYHVAGSGELVDMKVNIRGWEKKDFNDAGWKMATSLSYGMPKNVNGEDVSTNGWLLIPSIIPPMELTYQRLSKVRRHSVGVKVPADFAEKKRSVTVPSNTTATILLDQGFLTNTYPTIVFSGGKNSGISLTYAEALYTKFPYKNNRNEVDGKYLIGRKDSVLSAGVSGQSYTPFSWRTYRYLEVCVTTGPDPLTIEDIYGMFTGYPFKMNATLQSENPELEKILEIGWRTARLNAFETYMDCPYYEQLQYIGDTRIQAMVSLYNSGDDRLVRNALNNMDNSRQPEGITLSRHPSKTPQYIPTFSLWYLGMLHDYWMYGKDEAFVKDKLPGERQVLSFFRKYQQADGSLKNVPYWMFTDWVGAKDWHIGTGPRGKDGTSAMLDLQLLLAYQTAADMESKIGMKEYAALYSGYADQLKTTIRRKYWNSNRKIFADRAEKDLYSQHTNTLAILSCMFTKDEMHEAATTLLTDQTLAPASIYFKYYLHQALVKAGLGNNYINWLDIWRENIKMGMTTWGETSKVDSTRSDCHAWGASPNIEFFRTVLGIDTDAPGFAKVKIEPHLGDLKKLSGTMPHPAGTIAVDYALVSNKWKMTIALPQSVSGTFIWQGRSHPLAGGKNVLEL